MEPWAAGGARPATHRQMLAGPPAPEALRAVRAGSCGVWGREPARSLHVTARLPPAPAAALHWPALGAPPLGTAPPVSSRTGWGGRRGFRPGAGAQGLAHVQAVPIEGGKGAK